MRVMKNKLIKFFLLIIIVLVGSSCSCKKDNYKVNLQVGDMSATSYKDISETSLNKMIKNIDKIKQEKSMEKLFKMSEKLLK